MNFDQQFDASGLACPMPILKASKALSGMASGQVLKLVATDCGAAKDVQAYADQTGNFLLSTEQAKGAYTFYIRKN